MGVAPRDRGLGSDFITSGAVEVMVEEEVNTGVVKVLAGVFCNCSTPDCVNWASCWDVKINGALLFGCGSARNVNKCLELAENFKNLTRLLNFRNGNFDV